MFSLVMKTLPNAWRLNSPFTLEGFSAFAESGINNEILCSGLGENFLGLTP
jgi:hypothetical protein